MTPTLIDQLKLAIQVESGEVPWSEIQYLPKSEDENFGWICVSPLGTPSWNFTNAIYRRKPKPLEFWVNVYNGNELGNIYESEMECRKNVNVQKPIMKVAVHMREVSE